MTIHHFSTAYAEALAVPALDPQTCSALDVLQWRLSNATADLARKGHLSDQVALGRLATTDEAAIYTTAVGAFDAAAAALIGWPPRTWIELEEKAAALESAALDPARLTAALRALRSDLATVRGVSALAAMLSDARRAGDDANAISDYTEEGDHWLGAPLWDRREELLDDVHAAPCCSLQDAAVKVSAVRLSLMDLQGNASDIHEILEGSLAGVCAMLGGDAAEEPQLPETARLAKAS
ncbi:hypothetical protein [Caulobacter sp. S45]|uniref:hypothetical protein n=1 Tax=Caulobacter sp. S45 TaxID=1641861 RepID=UPI00131AC991|nr:hypothetical protein [Caulobacter sp. S45]